MTHVRTTYFVFVLGNMTVVKSDDTNRCSSHYEKKSSFPKVIRHTDNVFHHRYVLMGDIF